jgi:hypothetical protein
MGLKWSAVQGPLYWQYEGETLDERRRRMKDRHEISIFRRRFGCFPGTFSLSRGLTTNCDQHVLPFSDGTLRFSLACGRRALVSH